MAKRGHPTAASGSGIGINFQPSEASNDAPGKLVGIIGHSYVSRLEISRSEIYEPGFVVRTFGAPGATLDNIREKKAWDDLLALRPEVAVLVLGGNDIVTGVVPRELATKLRDLALEIEENIHGRCLVLGIEPRESPRGISAADYHKVKNAVNALLKRKHKHLDGRFAPYSFGDQYMSEDGIHLTYEGGERLLDQILKMVRDHLSSA